MTRESAGALAVRERDALAPEVTSALTGAQLKFIANTEFVPAAMRGKLPAIMACVATGRALGLADMSALRSIAIVDGKATFSAELMVSLVRKAGHSIIGEVSPEAAKITGKRRDNGDTMNVEWTLEQASKIQIRKKGGGTMPLTDKDNWKNYPEAMLWARAVSQLCRMLFADCFAGASYTPEELGYGDITADELMDEAQPEPAVDPSAEEPELEAEDAEIVDDPAEPTAPVSDEQRQELLELVATLSEKHSGANWSQELTKRMRQEFGVGSYNDLTGAQMGELLEWLREAGA